MQSSNFYFFVFGKTTPKYFSVIYKSVTYIEEVLTEFFLLVTSDLYVEITNISHLRREIDHNLQFVAYRLYTTKIMDLCGTPHCRSAEVENLSWIYLSCH